MWSPGTAGRRRADVFRALPSGALTAGGWGVGLVVTSFILGTPYLVFGYHSPSLHLVLDTVDACVALLVAYLLHGRFVRTGRLQDVLLAQGLFLLALAGLGLTLLLDVLPAARPETLGVWLALTLRLLGALFVLASALAGDRRAHPGFAVWGRVVPWLVLIAVFGLLAVNHELLPPALDASPPPSAQRPVITGHSLLLVSHGLTALCFGIASVAFAVHAARRHDELLRWVGPALALGACARLNYLLFPSLYSDWLYTGDLLRTGCYLLLLVGAGREIGEYWSSQAQAAVLEDRRRLARELHDGVVQELGYIRAEARVSAPGSAERIVASADRALDEARGAIDALGRSVDEPLGAMLQRAARQVSERHGGRLDTELDLSVTADAEQRHALVRITREAVSNALRHGRAQQVVLTVENGERGRRLTVRDDGLGFDVEAARRQARGYGLTSMRDRASALPGTLTIESRHGEGTEVSVTW
ncbi:signal transduction histidine kinase [Georgenia soli]|uniref:Signal transduction histidine kinase n=1 Tax=Georgenia soli TaxID=638953 RepID=A0A2A9EH51_9MICO|nr:ATP-binding protein [Georgenia soli]PFG38228.1 signal transduction histidine kinase [Georgenia soli]